MASTTFTVVTATLSGAVVSTVSSVMSLASSDTCTITPSTAQGALNTKGLFIRATNTSSTASVTISIGAGTRYSEIGRGKASVTVATNSNVIIGGRELSDARFMITAGTIVLTVAGTGPTTIEAFQPPRATESAT
jgi:hypothetical protein